MDLGLSLLEVLGYALTLLIRAGIEAILFCYYQLCIYFLSLVVVTESTDAAVTPFPFPTAS